MFYRPKFCCNCGEKIERTDWKLWTSRRFCDFCEVEQMPYDIAIKLVAVIVAVFGVAGIANTWLFRPPSDGDAHTQQQNSAQPARLTGLTTQTSLPISNIQTANTTGSNQSAPDSNSSIVSQPDEPSKQRKKPRNSSEEPIYYCGAMTKKGTACMRRVKSPGRCWQHLGKPSMLPANSS